MALSKRDLELIAAIGQEMRKPNALEQKKLDEDEAAKKASQEERLVNSAAVKEQMRLRKQEQMTCSHQHPDGHTHLARIIENGKLAGGPGLLLCQWCNAEVGPRPRPRDEENRPASDLRYVALQSLAANHPRQSGFRIKRRVRRIEVHEGQ